MERFRNITIENQNIVEKAMLFIDAFNSIPSDDYDCADCFQHDAVENILPFFDHCLSLFNTEEAQNAGYGYFSEFVQVYAAKLFAYLDVYFSDDLDGGIAHFIHCERFFLDERYLDELYTLEELKGEWKTQVQEGNTELGFDGYVTSCLACNNGTLTEIKSAK